MSLGFYIIEGINMLMWMSKNFLPTISSSGPLTVSNCMQQHNTISYWLNKYILVFIRTCFVMKSKATSIVNKSFIYLGNKYCSMKVFAYCTFSHCQPSLFSLFTLFGFLSLTHPCKHAHTVIIILWWRFFEADTLYTFSIQNI